MLPWHRAKSLEGCNGGGVVLLGRIVSARKRNKGSLDLGFIYASTFFFLGLYFPEDREVRRPRYLHVENVEAFDPHEVFCTNIVKKEDYHWPQTFWTHIFRHRLCNIDVPTYKQIHPITLNRRLQTFGSQCFVASCTSLSITPTSHPGSNTLCVVLNVTTCHYEFLLNAINTLGCMSLIN